MYDNAGGMELASIPENGFHSIITDAPIDAELNKNEPDNQPIDFFEKSYKINTIAMIYIITNRINNFLDLDI